MEKKELFEEVRKNVWSVFNSKRAELRAELEKAIAADCITDPAALDTNAVYLLDSGTMTAADYAAFAEKYDGNSTMLKLVAARAHAAAESAEPKERAALNQVYSDCKDGNSAIMRLWDDISHVANRCSGQRYEGCNDFTPGGTNRRGLLHTLSITTPQHEKYACFGVSGLFNIVFAIWNAEHVTEPCRGFTAHCLILCHHPRRIVTAGGVFVWLYFLL